MVQPHEIQIGYKVIYSSSPNLTFTATVSSEPWQLGSGEWVVQLKDLPKEYADTTCRGATRVPAASLHAIELAASELGRIAGEHYEAQWNRNHCPQYRQSLKKAYAEGYADGVNSSK